MSIRPNMMPNIHIQTVKLRRKEEEKIQLNVLQEKFKLIYEDI